MTKGSTEGNQSLFSKEFLTMFAHVFCNVLGRSGIHPGVIWDNFLIFLVPISPTRIGQEAWGVGGKGRGKAPPPKRERGQGKVGPTFWIRIPLGNQTRSRHPRTKRHETKRFPCWTHPPTSDSSQKRILILSARDCLGFLIANQIFGPNIHRNTIKTHVLQN